MSERVKSDNEKGYYILDAINSAIDSKKKISFQYIDYDVAGRQFLKHDGKPYLVSPYELIWDGDFYYVVGYNDGRSKVQNFRLDRIAEKAGKFWKMTANLCQMGLILICTENQFSRCLEQITQRVLSFSVIRL